MKLLSAIRAAAWAAGFALLAVCPAAGARAPGSHGPFRVPAGAGTASLQWGWANPRPSSDRFEAIAQGGGVYVAVGTDGVIYSSADGVQWTARSSGLGVGSAYTGVIYGNGRFLAVGVDGNGKGHAEVSRDGAAWSDQETGWSLVLFPGGGLAFGNGVFVATDGNRAFSSTDGLTWRSHAIGPTGFEAPYLAFAAGKFAALGWDPNNGTLSSTAIYYSSDGNAWTKSSFALPTSSYVSLNTIEGGGPGFLLTGYDNGPCSACAVTYTSPDGVNWKQQSNIPGAFTRAVIWDGSRFLTDNNGYIYSSTDGTAWIQGPKLSSSFFPYASKQVAAAPGNYITVGGLPLSISKSSDLANWNLVFNGVTGSEAQLWWATYQNGKFFATGFPNSAADVIVESDDGLHWSQVYDAASSNVGWPIPVTFGNGTYVAIDSNGTALLSSDGAHWSADATSPPDHMLSLAYGNGVFVASGMACSVTCSNLMYTSPDGVTWTSHDVSSATSGHPLGSVVFKGSEFIGLSAEQTVAGTQTTGNVVVLSSSDGVNWTPTGFQFPSGVTVSDFSLVDGELLMAGANDNIVVSPILFVYKSTDGVNWSGGQLTGVQSELLPFVGLTHAGSYYYMMFGQLYASSDAMSWTPVGNVPAVQINRLVGQNGRLYAFGTDGAVLVAEPGGAEASAGSVKTDAGRAVKGTLAVSGSTGGTLTYSVAAVPAHGSVTITDAATGAFTYTPTAGFSGSDQFTFAVDDGVVKTMAVETVTVTGSTSQGGGSGGLGLLEIGLLAFLLLFAMPHLAGRRP
ncbi:MAG: Ig-like domain-containing protein [Bacillota bacterium]